MSELIQMLVGIFAFSLIVSLIIVPKPSRYIIIGGRIIDTRPDVPTHSGNVLPFRRPCR